MKNTMQAVTTNNHSWFKRWFDSSFYHKLYAHRDEKEAADFIDELLAALQPPPNACMLDLGCGMGRHSKYLASKRFEVTGTDLSFSSIKSARQFQTMGLRFYQHDMRIPFGNNHFDYVFNFFTSFGYFKSEAENQQVMNNIFQALKPGGTVVMDYLNTTYAENHSVPCEQKEIDGLIYQITRWADEKYFYKKIIIDDKGTEKPFEYTEQVAKLRLHDFKNLFNSNELQLQDVYGDYQLNRYDAATSPRLVLIAKKASRATKKLKE